MRESLMESAVACSPSWRPSLRALPTLTSAIDEEKTKRGEEGFKRL